MNIRVSTDKAKKVGDILLHCEIIPKEASLLWNYHNHQAEYWLGCKQRNIEIANTRPLYTFGSIQTKEDWLKRASIFDKKQKYHRKRAQIFLKLLKNNS